MQNGTIKVESELGKGSVFIVEIPYDIADVKTIHRVSDSGLIDLNSNFKAIKILLVEDNLMNQRVIGLFLSEWGIDYDIADNGGIAIQLLASNSYDLVLMDIQMPEMDGYTSTAYIREEMKLQIPIIAMTAHAMAGEREKALSHGMNEYISKPIREADLFLLISRFVPLFSRKKSNTTLTEPKIENHNPTDTGEILIDYNFLMESSKGKKDYLKSMLELFLQQSAKEMQSIQQAMHNNDFDAVAKTAHALKSTVGYVGLEKSIRPILDEIENQAKENPDPDSLNMLIAKLKALMKQAILKIETEAMPLVN
ncbi:MAG TPA: response regulator [Saprospiraceae bacterium]|nr:response regulator [Saprospiraceae bacterium]